MDDKEHKRLQEMADRKEELEREWSRANELKEDTYLEYEEAVLECERLRLRINDLEMEMERLAGCEEDIPEPQNDLDILPGQTSLIPGHRFEPTVEED